MGRERARSQICFLGSWAKKKNGTCSHGFNQSIEHAVNADVEKHDVSRLWET